MLFTKNVIETRFKKKLFNKYTELFEIIEKVKKQAYCLKLSLK